VTRPASAIRPIHLALTLTLFIGACLHPPLPPVAVDLPATAAPVSYLGQVAPLLDARCVVCHSCYNGACQLKLSSYEGVDRGGSKLAVYSGSRISNQAPTRLFVDAQSTEAWRTKGFHSVTENTAEGAFNNSVMLHLLDAKRKQPLPKGDYHAEAEDLSCAANESEVSAFIEQHPSRGMPFGFPALSDGEYATLAIWLQQGAQGPNAEEQERLTQPSPAAAKKIESWEAFLNVDDAKHAMTARYLYEHFFLAHLNFRDADDSQFFRLVRSTTPPGEPISVIATVRPYDDPEVSKIFYRFEKIHSTIVYKTHMVVPFTDETLARFQELFIDTPWLEPPHRVALGDTTGANPFLVFQQIPPIVRYRFMLDHSEYFIRTFIRGPVCKGQIALNVIHDHFWTFFLDPDHDQTVLNPEFLIEQASNLRLPNEKGSDGKLIRAFSNVYRDRYANFYRAKQDLYDEKAASGFDIDSIWKGRQPADSPVLTIYRHFDSASVHRGVLGDLPRTLWVIDYPQLERIYYALVAGFDVFGNLTHQVNVRRYMDYLRIEGELNFLEFLPSDIRLETLQSWYLGDRAMENVKAGELNTHRDPAIVYETEDPKRELVERIVDQHIPKQAGIRFDRINYHRADEETPMPSSFETHEDILNAFKALTAPGTDFIRRNNDSGVNVMFVRVRNYQGEDRFFSIVVNRWHDNVNSMFDEGSRLNPSKDTMDFIPGSIGSYPNYFFDLDGSEVPEFFDMLENYDSSPRYVALLDRLGVNRDDPKFWEVYDWFQQQLNEADPLVAGRYDLNRYYHYAGELVAE
jgi:hypothetical protein